LKRILVDMPADATGLARLAELPEVVVTQVEPSEDARELPSDLIRDQQVLFCSVPPTNVGDMAALEFVQIASVGYSQLYGLHLDQRGIRAGNARGVFDTAIAEWNVAMMVNLARDLRGMIRNQEHGVWDRSAGFQAEVRGSVVGLWGYGGIGRETARLAKTMGMTVHVLSRQGVSPRANTYLIPGTGDPEGQLPDRVFLAGQEQEFLAGLDFLVLAMPLTPATTGLVGEQELRALPPTAYLLNPARGPLVREEALLRALREGWIAGAALDTHYHYPMPADHPLWRFPNVIMTPHISGSSASPFYLGRIWEVFVQNVQRLLAGQPLLNELTPAQLAGE
jgi:phosphoglycerate dehydrogenase-like enzyme